MAREDMTITLDTSAYSLVLSDIEAAWHRLPPGVKHDLAPLLERLPRLQTWILVGTEMRAAPVLVAFDAFMQRLADQFEA